MKDDFENVYDMIEHAIEYAFQGKMQLKFYEFLKYRKTTKAEVDAFYQQFGQGSTFPQVVLNGDNLGGCTETVQYLKENNLV